MFYWLRDKNQQLSRYNKQDFAGNCAELWLSWSSTLVFGCKIPVCIAAIVGHPEKIISVLRKDKQKNPSRFHSICFVICGEMTYFKARPLRLVFWESLSDGEHRETLSVSVCDCVCLSLQLYRAMCASQCTCRSVC